MESTSLVGRDVVEIRVCRPEDIPAVRELAVLIGAGAHRVDEPARQIAVPVVAGTDRLADAVRMLAAAGIDVDDVRLRAQIRQESAKAP